MSNGFYPKVRFKGHTNAWEQRKLGDKMYIKSRIGWQALTRKEYLETGDYYLITGTDIDEDKHVVDLKRCYYVSKERYEMDDKIQVHEGDIIVTKDGTIGKVAMVTGLDKPATLNSHLFVLRDMSGTLYNRFLLQILSSHVFDAFVESTKTGSTLTGLPQKTFVEFKFLAPNIDEQKKISRYLDNLDDLITLHQRKYQIFQKIKSSMLEKMFPHDGKNTPELRFVGFTGAWKQRKLGDMGTSFTGLSGKTKDDFGHGDAKFVTYMNVFTNPVSDSNDVEAVEIDKSQNAIQYGDIFFTTSSETPEEVGMSSVWLEKTDNTYLNSFCFGYRPTEKNDPYYMAYMLRSEAVRKKIIYLAQGISRYNISKKGLMQIEVPLPDISEQYAIGRYFENLDNLINFENDYINKLKTIKQAFLKKVFARVEA